MFSQRIFGKLFFYAASCKKMPYCVVSGWFGTRHFVTLMLFFGMANAYTMRTNMSVAIVAMVNHTALPKLPTVVTEECPNRPANMSHDDDVSGTLTLLR